MALINKQQEIFWKVIQQTERTGAWSSAVQEARVVLNAAAIAQLLHHLQVIVNPFFDPLCFNMLAFSFEILHLCKQFILYFAYNLSHLVFRCDIEVGGKDGRSLNLTNTFAIFNIKTFDLFDFIFEESDAISIVHIGQVNIYCVSFHTEGASGKFALGAVVQRIDQCV
ncbi:hypothetical protein D9M68_862240 [compost metagenome]